MLLTISTNHKPGTDLGFLLHKHTEKFQSINLSIGQAHIFYPEQSPEQTTVALLLDIDPIDMVKNRVRSGGGFSLAQYVNDRPYVASSFLSVAISKAFSTTMNGTCKAKPELVDTAMDFSVRISVVSAPRGGEILIRSLFEPLCYSVNIQRHTLDDQFVEWGDSRYFTLELSQNITLKELLSHLYVLIPALDQDKHYFVSQQEIDKLLKKGKGWLSQHPHKETITRRYLLNLRSLSYQALERLREENDTQEQEETQEEKVRQESLHQKRLKCVLKQLKESGAKRVLDLGCGEGKLIKLLLKEKQFTQIVGTDVCYTSLSRAKDRLYWNEMAPRQKERIDLFQGALTYKDKRLEGFDAAAIVEVIEHLEEDRLEAFERVVFEHAKPTTVILTTPNREFNSQFENMKTDSFRHTDHRFEWTRHEFETWAKKVAETFHYSVSFVPIGDEVEGVGAPSQMGVFRYAH